LVLKALPLLLLKAASIEALKRPVTHPLRFLNFYFPSEAQLRFATRETIQEPKYWGVIRTPIALNINDPSQPFQPRTLGICKGDGSFLLARQR
jgi:hypothetical protein